MVLSSVVLNVTSPLNNESYNAVPYYTVWKYSLFKNNLLSFIYIKET